MLSDNPNPFTLIMVGDWIIERNRFYEAVDGYANLGHPL